MPPTRRYLLDTNVFVQAKRRYYGFDVCPGFWRCLIWHHRKATILSIDKVKQEIDIGADDLTQWASDVLPGSCFPSCDDLSVIAEFANMQAWAQAQAQFTAPAKAEFASVADGWLVAYAKVMEMVVVTEEEFAPDARRRIPIPNVCQAFGVPYMNTFSMLRDLGAEFNWRRPRGR